MSMIFPSLLAAAISLGGVTGERLRARAFFDVYNVKVGDPMVLTVDFLGEADFAALHPPALARAVDRREWRLSDASAKTDTYRDARRLTYRVRPLKEGVLFFPALEFEYLDRTGAVRTVRSNTIPVHAVAGAQVVVEGMDEVDADALPKPPELVDLDQVTEISDDERFAWRRAMANPSADAFRDFAFPAGRLNEAAMALEEGDWRRAERIYARLEWRIGQTPEIERGIVVALAQRYQNPQAELPVWREVGRPILRYAWAGRLGIVGGGIVAILLGLWAFGRLVRRLAAWAVLLAGLTLPFSLVADADPFASLRQMEAEMNRLEREMREQMQGRMQGLRMTFGGGEEMTAPEVKATVTVSKTRPRVGESFDFIVALEAPRTVSIGQVQLTPSEWFGLKVLGSTRNLSDLKAANPSNVIKRIAVPVRYDVPFRGEITFDISGMLTGRCTGRGGRMTFTFSNSFSARSTPCAVAVEPLDPKGQPANFSGIVADNLRVTESLDGNRVGTNDVIVITYALRHDGYVPADWMIEGSAYEWERGPLPDADRDYREAIFFKRYFIADGSLNTPKAKISYYSPRLKRYQEVTVGGTRVYYKR